ncbi:MAG: MarR family transcriptional regulator [Bacteroidia bacterium]|nr:MarR family transcriptional regulator [Sphingobacteriaceae bacterium]MBL7911777.1 MarR family transcriptional regulator [Bacteroidia bacterium]
MAKEGLEFYSFINDRQKALVNIYFTNNWLHNEYHVVLKAYNVTAQQFNILKILNEVYPKSMMVSTIKLQMLDKSSDITRLVERLLEKNLVVRRQDQKNRRKINVKLNIIGHSLVSKMDKDIRNFEGFVEHLSDKEIKQLNSLLNKIRSL